MPIVLDEHLYDSIESREEDAPDRGRRISYVFSSDDGDLMLISSTANDSLSGESRQPLIQKRPSISHRTSAVQRCLGNQRDHVGSEEPLEHCEAENLGTTKDESELGTDVEEEMGKDVVEVGEGMDKVIEEKEDYGKNKQMVDAQEETEWEAQAELDEDSDPDGFIGPNSAKRQKTTFLKSAHTSR